MFMIDPVVRLHSNGGMHRFTRSKPPAAHAPPYTPTLQWIQEEKELSLRAVVFDYGMVLSGPPHPAAHEELKRITGLSHEEFERLYWVDRHAYDRGDLTGLNFWRKLVSDANLNLAPARIAELNQWDARMWTTTNEKTLAWHRQLKQRGLKTGILSNMGDSVLESIQVNFSWIEDFDVLIWSYQHRMAKPQPEIYHLLLDKLGTIPEETLFLDDKIENIQAARHLGICALQFSTVDQLREDLISSGLDASLPLPPLLDSQTPIPQR
jgi:putative hydrolase of the HAD superfamily